MSSVLQRAVGSGGRRRAEVSDRTATGQPAFHAVHFHVPGPADARMILTDIEGTTSSISFVKDVLFPYARRALPGFVAARGQEPEVRAWLDAVGEETGAADDAAIVASISPWLFISPSRFQAFAGSYATTRITGAWNLHAVHSSAFSNASLLCITRMRCGWRL